jgi:hypothetical protein
MARRILETLGAGVVVYVLMAACSGSGGGNKGAPVAASVAGMPSAGGQEGQGGVSAGGEPGAAGEVANAGMAGLLSPVAGASAQAGGATGAVCDCPEPPEPYVPPEPTVVEAECDIVGPSGTMFAEAAFPGLDAGDLTNVVAVVTFPHTIASKIPTSAPDGYYTQLSTVFVRDGFAATHCGSSGNEHVASTVTFVLP